MTPLLAEICLVRQDLGLAGTPEGWVLHPVAPRESVALKAGTLLTVSSTRLPEEPPAVGDQGWIARVQVVSGNWQCLKVLEPDRVLRAFTIHAFVPVDGSVVAVGVEYGTRELRTVELHHLRAR